MYTIFNLDIINGTLITARAGKLGCGGFRPWSYNVWTEVYCPISSDLPESLITTLGGEVACCSNVMVFLLPIGQAEF